MYNLLLNNGLLLEGFSILDIIDWFKDQSIQTLLDEEGEDYPVEQVITDLANSGEEVIFTNDELTERGDDYFTLQITKA